MQQRFSVRVFGYGLLMAAVCLPAAAATLCVNPSGNGGCSTKINDAVAKAAPGDKIQVAAGTYKEDVIIGKSLSLIGHDADDTIIDATGLANGVYVGGQRRTQRRRCFQIHNRKRQLSRNPGRERVVGDDFAKCGHQ